MVAKERRSSTDSPKVAEVGEIDTRAPFQSVKDAVTLFGEGALSGEKPAIRKARRQSAERVLAKETELHLAQKELDKLKDKLKNAETTKVQALVELEKAKRTVNDLTQKLNMVTESKDFATRATELANSQAKSIEEAKSGDSSALDAAKLQDLESAREQYTATVSELDSAKQELRKIRQEHHSSLDAKLAALIQVAEAEHTAKLNVERVSELSKEILALEETIGQVQLASLEAQQDQARIFSEKDVQRQTYRGTLEALAKKLQELKNNFDPDRAHNLEVHLSETTSEIGSLQQQLESGKASDLDSVRTVTSELDGARESLQRVAEEETDLRNLIESLKIELEKVKQEHSDLREKEAETESVAGNLHVKLRKVKSELEAAVAEESVARGASEEMISTLHQLSLEAENARREAEETKKNAEELNKEAEATRIALEEAEKKLRVALEEAEEAKLAEASALYQIMILSERTNAVRTSTSESGAKIIISRDEFEALSRKLEESDSVAEMKVAAALAQVEAVKASENEAVKRLEAMQKEVEDMKIATAEALKRAEMAEAAKRAVEGELRRWREREQKKAAETASRILAETEVSSESSPRNHKILNQNPTPQKIFEVRKLEKAKTSVQKKQLLPNLSGIFHRKKNQVEGGSPSYLPGENPV